MPELCAVIVRATLASLQDANDSPTRTVGLRCATTHGYFLASLRDATQSVIRPLREKQPRRRLV